MTNKIFDDLVLKEKLGKITLNLRTKKDITSWQANRFIADLQIFYYKTEILNSIANALNEGVKPENIIILDHSFNISRIYSKIYQISLKNIAILYSIGLPYALNPSERSIAMRYILRYFRATNTILRKYKQDVHYVDELAFYVEAACKESLETAVEILKSKSLEEIELGKTYESVKSDLDKKYSSLRNEFEKELNLIQKKEGENQYNSQNFCKIFNTIKRPVVFVFDESFSVCRVLCRNQISKNLANGSTFNIKSISHNSPFDFLISAGGPIISGLINTEMKVKEHQLEMEIKEMQKQSLELELEIKKTELENKRLELEEKKRRLENKQKEIKEEQQNITNINIYLTKNDAYQIESITNQNLKSKINNMQSMVVQKYQNVKKANGIYIDYSRTKIDYLV